MAISISVIIPTINEADYLPKTLNQLVNCQTASVIVVDAGSSDQTPKIATLADTDFVSVNPTNRATQLNFGASRTNADVLLFLHADTLLTEESFKNLTAALETDPELAGGGFARVFDSASPVLKLTCLFSKWRSKFFGVFLGDQAIFVRRSVFEQIGGFCETLAMGEDLDFSLKLNEQGFKTACIEPSIKSSARRFSRRGSIIQTIIDLWLTIQILRTRK